MISLRLASCVLLLAAFSPAPQIYELRDVDLSGWDCLTKPGGAAKTEDGDERNRQKNRSAIDLSGLKIKSLGTVTFLAQAADYDRQIGKKHRRFLTPPER